MTGCTTSSWFRYGVNRPDQSDYCFTLGVAVGNCCQFAHPSVWLSGSYGDRPTRSLRRRRNLRMESGLKTTAAAANASHQSVASSTTMNTMLARAASA